MAVRLMQLFSSNEVDMCPLMSTLGLYFQIRDDYANLNSKEVLIHLLTQTIYINFNSLTFWYSNLFSTSQTKVTVRISQRVNFRFQSSMQSVAVPTTSK